MSSTAGTPSLQRTPAYRQPASGLSNAYPPSPSAYQPAPSTDEPASLPFPNTTHYREGIKITGWRLLNTAIPLAFGTWKCVLGAQGSSQTPTTIDFLLGIIWALTAYWVNQIEMEMPDTWKWFFQADQKANIRLFVLLANRFVWHLLKALVEDIILFLNLALRRVDADQSSYSSNSLSMYASPSQGAAMARMPMVEAQPQSSLDGSFQYQSPVIDAALHLRVHIGLTDRYCEGCDTYFSDSPINRHKETCEQHEAASTPSTTYLSLSSPTSSVDTWLTPCDHSSPSSPLTSQPSVNWAHKEEHIRIIDLFDLWHARQPGPFTADSLGPFRAFCVSELIRLGYMNVSRPFSNQPVAIVGTQVLRTDELRHRLE